MCLLGCLSGRGEQIHNELQAEPVRKPAEPSRAEELEWKLSGALSKQIKDAEADTDAFIASAELEVRGRRWQHTPAQEGFVR